MRLCIQRVKSGSVTVDGNIIGQIGKGLVVLIGIGDVDGADDVNSEILVKWACDKILGLKFWANEDGKPWKMSVTSLNLEVLLISQFTLFGKVKSNKSLDFHKALSPGPAQEIYNHIVAEMQNRIGVDRTQTGEFGADMKVRMLNDGPVTITIDSKNKE